MSTMSLVWTLSGTGWATCMVADDNAQASVEASYITDAPGDLLRAVARLTLGDIEQRVDFNMEPTEIRWVFTRTEAVVDVRLLEIRAHSRREDRAAVLWTSRQPVGTLARTVIRAFDNVAELHSEAGYLKQWRRPFPRQELEVLRRAWRSAKRPDRA